jgi:plasmid maintenance system antidote protein VapI
MTISMALRLAKYFGVSAAFWMNLQLRRDLYHVEQSENQDLKKIRNYSGNRPDAHDLSKIAVLKIYQSRTKASGR